MSFIDSIPKQCRGEINNKVKASKCSYIPNAYLLSFNRFSQGCVERTISKLDTLDIGQSICIIQTVYSHLYTEQIWDIHILYVRIFITGSHIYII